MATRSTIWYKDEIEKVYKGIYCHWDGYVEYNGRMLFNHYNNIDKIKELISLGSISSLKENVKPSEGSNHSFSNPDEDVVIAYHRDRGEELCIYSKTTLEGIRSKGEEYDYVFQNNVWYLLDNNLELRNLSDFILKLDDQENNIER